jgi:hypothetical protein
MKTIETYLPVFPGFYGTIFEPNEDGEIEHFNDLREQNKLTPVKYERFKFDYENYQNDIGRNCCKFIQNELSGFVSSINFETIQSPREYNFVNDSINCEIELSDENIVNIIQFLQNNKELFGEYLRVNLTSCSGFISYYSNSLDLWLDQINEALQHETKLGIILEFICQVNRITYEDMYSACDDVYLSVKNGDELEYYEYCNICNSFIRPDMFAGNCCNDCINTQIKDFEVIICSCCKTEITNPNEKRHFTHQLAIGKINYNELKCSDCELIYA